MACLFTHKTASTYTSIYAEKQIAAVAPEQQLEGLTPELKSYWDNANELKQAEAELEFKRKYGKQQYLGRLVGLQVDVYNEICRVVELYAKEKGFDLILRVEEPRLDDDDLLE